MLNWCVRECVEQEEKKKEFAAAPSGPNSTEVCVYLVSGVGAWGCLGITWCNCRVSRGVTAHLATDAPTGRQVGTDDNKWAGRMQCMFTERFCKFTKKSSLSPVVTVYV